MYKTNGIKPLALGGSVLITSKSYELPLTILLDAVSGYWLLCSSVKVIVFLQRRWGRGGVCT